MSRAFKVGDRVEVNLGLDYPRRRGAVAAVLGGRENPYAVAIEGSPGSCALRARCA